jgi:hypothetical protein
MRKIVVLLMAVTFSFAMVGCGKKETPAAPATNKTEPAKTDAPKTDAPKTEEKKPDAAH